ncbi:MAG: hypothetical protein KAU20_01870 [Nanoarchaeota archaeon]|nr:hypothetical protein [Nanoarchaeota archaeon]
MYNTKKGAILIVFAILFSLVIIDVCAEENATIEEKPFQVKIIPVNNKIDFDETARFKITITNPRGSIEKFSIKPAMPYVEWYIKTDPISDYRVTAYPISTKDVIIVVKPLNVGIGRHALRINVKSETTKEIFKKDIIVNIVSMKNFPAISVSGKLPELIDPKESFVVKVWLENRNFRNLTDVKVELKSDAIRESTTTSLGSKGSGTDQKTLEFNIKLDPTEAPRKDILRIIATVKFDNDYYEFKSAPLNYEIIRYGNITTNHNPKFRFLGKYDELEFLNDANTKYEGVVKIRNPFYRALFTKTEPKGNVVIENGKRYLGWEASLGSQESINVIYRINYIPLFIVLIVLFVIVYSYLKFRSPVILTKSTKDIIKREGGIVQFKVVLEVKNRSKKTIENIEIIDRIPNITDFEKDVEVGTLHPSKIVNTRKGIVLRWDIDSIDRYEERVIKYRVRSRLSILGRFSLPVAIAKFKDKKGDIKRSYSNRAMLSS